MSLEVKPVANTINKMIAAIAEERAKLDNLGKNKARTEAEYQLAITTTMARLKSGEVFKRKVTQPDGPDTEVDIGCKAETNLKQTALGLCEDALYRRIVAESAYKNCVVNLDCLKAQMNAKQSIFRWLDNE